MKAVGARNSAALMALGLRTEILHVETQLSNHVFVQALKHFLGVLSSPERSETIAQVHSLVIGLEWKLDIDRNGVFLAKTFQILA